MNTKHRAQGHRASFRTALSTSLAVLGLCGGLMTSAAQATDRSANPSCRQETKRVAVWPKGPRPARQARFEEREVTVCDGEAMSKGSRETESPSSKSGD
ncbi:hypothetical protein JM946_19035 [Steroidobacter sp. S1-65]|uniref:Secreted protein n=1 Tax=Steroidobacter gossypii TaxID=2805490 RepID=A0ABS1X0U9_9GAMM|nr:hypothetical protein [Steroidobacter gossypii]MBM0106834.1 hypothetical protein [Steroidobacter gossypii]